MGISSCQYWTHPLKVQSLAFKKQGEFSQLQETVQFSCREVFVYDSFHIQSLHYVNIPSFPLEVDVNIQRFLA